MSQEQTRSDGTAEGSTGEPAGTSDSPDPDIDTLRAQLELLQEENERLRREYTRAKQTRYRQTAIGLAGIGIIALLAGIVFPAERTVLIALGATGLFGGLLTEMLTPERFVAASVGERTYAALADGFDRIVGALGLQDDRVYFPVARNGSTSVHLFVPQHAEYDLPDADSMSSPFVVPANDRARGLAVQATGDALHEELAQSAPGELATEPAVLLDQVGDGLVEQFELAESITTEVGVGWATVGVTGSVYGTLDRFDHPIPSAIGATLSTQLDTPVSVSVRPAEDNRTDVLVTCEWETETA
jgi:hypothetical protein